MVNVVTGLLAMLLMLVFLGNYAVKINALPLWIIIVVVAALPLYDFVQTLRNQNGND